jgi:hypothetical protein
MARIHIFCITSNLHFRLVTRPEAAPMLAFDINENRNVMHDFAATVARGLEWKNLLVIAAAPFAAISSSPKLLHTRSSQHYGSESGHPLPWFPDDAPSPPLLT